MLIGADPELDPDKKVSDEHFGYSRVHIVIY